MTFLIIAALYLIMFVQCIILCRLVSNQKIRDKRSAMIGFPIGYGLFLMSFFLRSKVDEVNVGFFLTQISFFSIMLIFNNWNLKTSLFQMVVVFAVIALSDAMVPPVFSIFLPGYWEEHVFEISHTPGPAMVLTNVIAGTFFIIFGLLYRLSVNVIKKIPKKTSLILKIVFSTMAVIAMLAAAIFFKPSITNSENITAISVFFNIQLSVMMIFYFNYLGNCLQLLNALKKNESYEQRELATAQLVSELRKVRHNYLNVLYGFAGHIESSSIDNLRQYYNETVEQIRAVNNDNMVAINKIHNAALCGLLAQHISLCLKQNIAFMINVEKDIDRLNVKDTDLCQVLGIFLDNAREATILTDAPNIKMDILAHDKLIEFYIYNCFKFGSEQTARDIQDDSRGMGLKYAGEILNKYKSAIWNTYIQNGMYVQQLLIKQ